MRVNNLTELFPEEEDKKVLSRKVLLMDGHNMAYRTVFTAIHQMPEDNDKFMFWKHLMMNSILNTIMKFSPDSVVMAFDTKGSWRYRIFDGYKANRRENRDKAAIDFDKFFPAFDAFRREFRETFSNIYVMEIPTCESDDIIAVLTKDVFKLDTEVIVISSDGDFKQLLAMENVKQYDPIKGKFITSVNPKRDLMVKILMGDRSDSIPAIKPKTGVVTAEKILREGLDDFLNKEGHEEYKTNFERNLKLISFDHIPQDVRSEIINRYNSYETGDLNGTKLMAFFTANRMLKHMEDWEKYSAPMKNLR